MTTKALILTAAGGILAASAAFALIWPRETAAAVPSEVRLAELESAILAGTESQSSLASSLHALVRRIDILEGRVERRTAEMPPVAPAVVPASPTAGGADPAAAAGREQFLSRLSDAVRMTRGGLGDAEEAFWEMARTTRVLEESIGILEARIAADPGDDEARMQLADAYVAKLLTVPYGPERGIWGARAEAEWKKVLERNPQHWEAQYVLAYNYSMYPDFLDKTDEAIAGFEAAVQIQEASQHRPEHAQTYVQLARMYEKKGQLEKAREALNRGASRHPGNEAIAEALLRLRDRQARF